MYQVLQDFMVFIKGSGYVVAGIALLGFIFFWLYLTGGHGRRHKAKRSHKATSTTDTAH